MVRRAALRGGGACGASASTRGAAARAHLAVLDEEREAFGSTEAAGGRPCGSPGSRLVALAALVVRARPW
jgi:hypothetical protein